MKNRVNSLIMISAMLLGQATLAQGKSILNSKHNLSASILEGQGTIKATTESEVCIFCHTPHNARQDIPYLWNRSAQSTIYTPYASSTLSATVGQPTGGSRLCLSCHDGTIALGKVLSEPTVIPFSGVTTLSGRNTSLATDLSDDHPISFTYQSSITSGNTELVAATALTSPVQLDSTGQLQCTACHDPHDDLLGKFLVKTNQGSALCIMCHTKTGWAGSRHATSTNTWTAGTDPWPDSDYTTVADNACGNCHRPHRADRGPRLLKQINEEDTCLACHSGQVASALKRIDTQLIKTYKHPVADSVTTGRHDAAEDFGSITAVEHHVECEDCHNSHQVKSDIITVKAPLVSGKNIGVQGITAAGTKIENATNLYEICFKCHAAASNNVIAAPEIPRKFDLPLTRLDTRVEFNYINNGISNSSHPVIRTTSFPYTKSLKASYQIPGGNIYCTDCHGSDTATSGAQGPHGSINKHLLVANYKTLDVGSTYNAADHALCYKCHVQAIIEGGDLSAPGGRNGIFSHGGHLVVKGNSEVVSCATCHDPHSSSLYPNLINFNTNQVTSFTSYTPGTPTTSPRCSLTCHNKRH